MAYLRTGRFGDYYGCYLGESHHLSDSQMETNARYIYSFLSNAGWSLNAISAILGNMQAESSINPGRWESEDVLNMSKGYGLVQWTPASKYIEWSDEQGYEDPSEMDNNLNRILYEVENGIQWIKVPNSYDISFKEFTTSDKSVQYLAESFLINYERPKDQSDSVKAFRGSLAKAWYTFLSGETPTDPSNPSDPSEPSETKGKRKGYNFLLFNSRRKKQWIKRNF